MFGAEWLASEHVRIVEQTLEEGVEGLLPAVWMRIEGTDRAEGIVITSSDYLGSRVCFCARITRVRSNIIKVGEFERLEPLVDNLTSEVFKGFNEWQKVNSN